MRSLAHASLHSCRVAHPLRSQEPPAPAAPKSAFALKSSRRSSLSHTVSGWLDREKPTLGRFGIKPSDPIYRELCSFKLAQVPSRKRIIGATRRLRLEKRLEAGCPVVPSITLARLPAETTFAKSPDAAWAFMDNNTLASLPIPSAPEYAWPLPADAPLLTHLQACLKHKKPAPLVIGLKLATEDCVRYTIHLPVEIELTSAD